jgi:Ca2+:H+ antiporter
MSDRTPSIWPTKDDFGALDWLLLALPAAIALRYVPGWRNDVALFVASGIAIVPLAGWLGRATEELGCRVGQGVGGLLNATFGNAAELIIALVALSHGLISVVKASISGSIIGNILLVLGGALLAGGTKYDRQTFNQTGARVAATSLTLAVIGLIVPTLFHMAAHATPTGWSLGTEQHLSLAVAVVLLLSYVLWLGFSLITHKQLFAGESAEELDEDHAGPPWPVAKSVLVLAIATVFVSIASELLVGSVEAARHTLGLTETFVGIVIVATIGNAAEHATAIMVALKNKVDLSLSITIGSSLQVALFVTPVLVIASHFLGHPMTLEFSLPEIAAIGLAVWIVGEIAGDGECNWFEGAQLLLGYAVIALLFYFLPDHA